MVSDMNDRLFLAEKKSAVTANIGKRQTGELRKEVQELQEEIVDQR